MREVTAGDTMLKTDGIIHGCEALEPGVLLDIFTPMRGGFRLTTRKKSAKNKGPIKTGHLTVKQEISQGIASLCWRACR